MQNIFHFTQGCQKCEVRVSEGSSYQESTVSLDWPLTLTTQPSTSKLSDNPVHIHTNATT